MMKVPDGTYVLTQHVNNPESNARRARNDWRFASGWDKGDIFYVRTVGPPDDRWQEVQLDGGHASITCTWDAFALIVMRCERMEEETPSRYLKRTECTYYALDVLDHLAATTGLTNDMIKAALKDIHARINEE